MEPVTHILTGWCLARTGFNRTTAYAAIAMAVAAELPDIDMLWELRGPVEQFQHHRGITHTFLGVPFEAALVVGAVWAWQRWRPAKVPGSRVQGARFQEARFQGARSQGAGFKGSKAQGSTDIVRWGWLYGGVLVALLSHLLLDFTNNYGIRPFFPFDAHWYAWSIVFIFDPWLFAMLLIALAAPALFGLVGNEVGAQRRQFQGRGWAQAGLIGVMLLYLLRSAEHGRAVQLAQAQSIAAPAAQASPQPTASETGVADDVAPADAVPVYLAARRTLASPDPLSPFQWSAVTDFGPVYARSEIDSLRGTLQANPVLTFPPVPSAAVRAAEASALGRAYLDWSPMPFVEAQAAADGGAVVTFSDPRFTGGWMAAHAALIGTVRLNARNQVVEQSLDGRVER
jgi:inner membrane protein